MKHTVTITKKEVTKEGGLYRVSAHVTIKNTSKKIVLSFPLVVKYNPDSPQGKLKNRLDQVIKIRWDEYLACQEVLRSDTVEAAFNTCTEGGLEG